MIYYLGNSVTLDFNVQDVNGNNVDPTTATLVITDPASAATTPALTHSGTGEFTFTYAPSLAGHYTYTFTTTGPGSGKIFGSFDVVSGQITLSGITFKSLIDEALSSLHGYTSDLEQLTSLSGDLNATDTQFTVADASQISRGLIEIDSELMWVTNVDRNANIVYLAPFGRGYRNSTATSHSADAQVMDSPRFPRASVKTAIQQVLSSVYPGIFQVLTDETSTVNPVLLSYPVPANADIILDVRWETVGPSQLWKQVTRYKLDVKADTSLFPTGKSLEIYEGMMPGRPIKITYIAQPGQFNSEQDTLGLVGLADTCRDILVFGACYRLLTSLEAARLQTSTVTQAQRDALTPPGSSAKASQFFYALYQQRLHDEQMRLQKLYPAVLHKTHR